MNITKHSGASRAEVVLEYSPDDVTLRIADDGVGFDERALHEHDTPRGPWSSFGLLGMRERMSGLGGRLELHNDQGAQVVAVVPRAPQEVEA